MMRFVLVLHVSSLSRYFDSKSLEFRCDFVFLLHCFHVAPATECASHVREYHLFWVTILNHCSILSSQPSEESDAKDGGGVSRKAGKVKDTLDKNDVIDLSFESESPVSCSC